MLAFAAIARRNARFTLIAFSSAIYSDISRINPALILTDRKN